MIPSRIHEKRLSGIAVQALATCGLLLTASCGETPSVPEGATASPKASASLRSQTQHEEDTCNPDDTPPVVTCRQDGGVVECGGVITSIPDLEYSDNCGVQWVTRNYTYADVGTQYTSAVVTDGRNSASCTTKWTVVDTHPPTVYVAGDSAMTLYQWQKYVEHGAYVEDYCTGWRGYGPYGTSGTVNTAVPGVYTITYTSTDYSNNTGTNTRRVTVVADPATVTSVAKSLQAHVRHTTTYIDNTRILVTGGYSRAAEEYNANTNVWTATGLPLAAHRGHTANLLNNNTVLVAGGAKSGTSSVEEIYDPQQRQWSATGKMSTVRYDHGAVVLSNGKVLVAGGGTGESSGGTLASAELYDPATRLWTSTGSMLTARRNFTLTLLPNDQVLATGGIGTDGTPQASAEVYSVSTGTWTTVGSMSTGRTSHAALARFDGKVYVTGGLTKNTALGASVEVYDPAARTWYARRSMNTSRRGHTLSYLNGKLVVIGGYNPQSGIQYSSEVYDEATDQWYPDASLTVERYNHTATPIGLDSVLLVSGSTNHDSTTTELYTRPRRE